MACPCGQAVGRGGREKVLQDDLVGAPDGVVLGPCLRVGMQVELEEMDKLGLNLAKGGFPAK